MIVNSDEARWEGTGNLHTFDDLGGSLEFLAQKRRPNSLSCLAVVKAKLETRIGSAECSGLGNRNKAMWGYLVPFGLWGGVVGVVQL